MKLQITLEGPPEGIQGAGVTVPVKDIHRRHSDPRTYQV